jgi:hypothetical protein
MQFPKLFFKLFLTYIPCHFHLVQSFYWLVIYHLDETHRRRLALKRRSQPFPLHPAGRRLLTFRRALIATSIHTPERLDCLTHLRPDMGGKGFTLAGRMVKVLRGLMRFGGRFTLSGRAILRPKARQLLHPFFRHSSVCIDISGS